MVNKNYIKGRTKEYKVKNQLEKEGWIVLRTAGSHGFADLIAIGRSKIRFIQCKPDNFSSRLETVLLKKHSQYNEKRLWKTTFEVI